MSFFFPFQKKMIHGIEKEYKKNHCVSSSETSHIYLWSWDVLAGNGAGGSERREHQWTIAHILAAHPTKKPNSSSLQVREKLPDKDFSSSNEGDQMWAFRWNNL